MKEIILRKTIIAYIKNKYRVSPEYPWSRYDTNAVFRHPENRKWFALVMDVDREKLGLKGDGLVAVMNLKVDDMFFRDMIIREEGIMPAYHMNKQHWITVLLDGTVPREQVYDLLEMSFLATAPAKKKEKLRPPKCWVVPANPKYYDVIGAFEKEEEIDWKQGNGIRVGDTVFLYVGSPVSAILFKCLVIKIMKIKLQKRYEPSRFTYDVLKEEYGIYAVRGPRGIPEALRLDLG